jgi:hypothetical protein
VAGLLSGTEVCAASPIECLSSAPQNLSFQWQCELKEKFDERFTVLKGCDIRGQFGINQWLENRQIITSLDLAKREDMESLLTVWSKHVVKPIDQPPHTCPG